MQKSELVTKDKETPCDKIDFSSTQSIQNLGALIVLDPKNGNIINSANIELLGKLDQEELTQLLNLGLSDNSKVNRISLNNKLYEVTLEHNQDLVILQIEPYFDFKSVDEALLEFFEVDDDLNRYLKLASDKIRALFGYDRVMCLKFHQDQHIEVVAESSILTDSYLGLHYPASDLPKPARDQYNYLPVRVIFDSTTEPIELVNQNFKPDLSNTNLRAVSPTHLMYLRNMRVRSTCSGAIKLRGDLWGLIVCHHSLPKWINSKARTSFHLITKIIGSIISNVIKFKKIKYLLESDTLNTQILNSIVVNGSLLELSNSLPKLKKFLKVDGVAVLSNHETALSGITPPTEVIVKIVSKLKENWVNECQNENGKLLISDCLKKSHLFSEEIINDLDNLNLSGILVSPIGLDQKNFFIFFRTKILQNVFWAGNTLESLNVGLSESQDNAEPRTSFKKWIQQIKDHSLPWLPLEIEAIEKLRSELNQFWFRRLEKLSKELKIAVSELDNSRIRLQEILLTISHDFNSPLIALSSYSHQIDRILSTANRLDDENLAELKSQNNKISKLSLKVLGLLKDVQRYTHLDRNELKLETFDPYNLLLEVVDYLKSRYNDPNYNIVVHNHFLPITADKSEFELVMANLIGNSIKHGLAAIENGLISRKLEIFINQISLLTEEKSTIGFQVIDNGKGISREFIPYAFDLFKREKETEDRQVEGSGVGLATVKRIIDRHKGHISIEPNLKEGVTVTVFF